ncbi:Uma2 family endonuclease [Longimicrobium sp.]|jgi:Uma2 family endonuclease|uniref:Uma2 family endonuclease n=1 Tax=Longimicrobium sp. TaxID=2029185 RepID=UPI002EDB8E8C
MSTQAPLQLDARTLSFEEFLEAYDGVHAEWVDGRVRLVSPGNERQSDLSLWLGALVRYWADLHDLGRTYLPNYSMKLSDGTAREPDVFFVRSEHLDRVRGTYVDGPADLVIEILSPSTRGVDRGEKFYEYEQAGVAEYWLIDPAREAAEAYRLDASGRYELVALGDPAVLRSNVLPGLEIPAPWLWQKPLPSLPWVFRQWEA